MTTQFQGPARLASEDVIISAPLSYVGSAQRIMRIRRRADAAGRGSAAIMTLVILLVVMAWLFVTAWYLTWGLLLVPYRVVRRGQRKRKVEELRHRELIGTLQAVPSPAPASRPGTELIADVDREQAVAQLQEHMLAGRLTTAEFEMRLALAQRARTQADVDAVMRDLPPSPGPGGRQPFSESRSAI